MPEGYGAGPLSRAVPYPPRARRSPLRRSMPYPPTPLPPAIPNWFLEAICDECGCDECGCDECGASGAAATHRHGHAGLYVGAGCHVTLQVQGLIVHRVHWPRRSGWWSERGVAGYRKDRWARGNLRGGRPIPSLPASTRREAGSAHTLPLFLAHDLEGVQHHIPTGQKSGTRRARSAAAINADAPAGSYDSTVHTIVDLLR